MSTPQLTETGHGATVIVLSEYSFDRDWRAFATWYTAHKMWPDADMALALTASNDPTLVAQCFPWAGRANLQKIRFRPGTDPKADAAAAAERAGFTYPMIVLDDDVIVARTVRPQDIPASGRSEDGAVAVFYEKNPANMESFAGLCDLCDSQSLSPFLRVEDRCGGYDSDQWNRVPFARTAWFRQPGMSHNETLVLDCWRSMERAYTIMVKV